LSDARLRVLIFFAAFGALALVTKTHAISWNDRTRFATIESLVDRGTFAIDGSPIGEGRDSFAFEGHTYSGQPPLLQIEGAVVAAVLKPLGVRLDRSPPETAIYLITLLGIGPWFGLGLVYAYMLQRDLGFEPKVALAVAAVTGFGTLAFPFALVFTDHVPAGAAALAGFFYLRRSGGPVMAALGAGFLALAVLFDEGAVALVLPLALLCLRHAGRARVGAALAAAIPMLALQLGFNHAISGGFGPPVLNAANYADTHSPFHLASTRPYLGRPLSPGYAFALAFGAQGLFSYSPAMLVAIAGLLPMWRSGAREVRETALAVGLASACYAAAVFAVTADTLSSNYGDRRWVDMEFLLCVPLGWALAAARGKGALRVTIAALVAASVALAALGSVEPFAPPPGVVTAGHLLLDRSPLLRSLDLALAALLICALTWSTWTATNGPPPGHRGAEPKPA
jgi:hypothetical protein